MAVTLTGTSSGDQGLFNRLGRMGYLLGLINTHRGTTLPTEVEDVVEYFDGANVTIRETVADLIEGMRNQDDAMGLLPSALQEAAQNTLIEMVHADTTYGPLPTKDVPTALDALKKQMLTATTTYVDANTLGATLTMTSLTGTGNVVVSTKNGRGVPLENLLQERLRLRCTDNTVSGSETITVTGNLGEADKLSHRWPAGSGAAASYESLASDSDNNLVTNGTFEAFTANSPDSWTVVVGSAGTDIDDEASIVYTGSKALKITGDGATLSQIRQAIADLESHTPYALNFACKVSSNPAAGELIVDLFDGSSVINDESGTANSVTVDLTTLGTTYVHKSVVFRLPEPVPATVYLRVRISTAITNTHVLYIDNLAMQEMSQPDTANPGTTPFIAVFSGAVGWSVDDGDPDLTNTFKIETTNDRASEWQTLFDRFFNTSQLGYTLPTSGSTLINDNLIA